MAVIKHLVDLDLTKQQLLNAAVQNLAVAPSSPVAGQIYWSTADDTLYVWNEADTIWMDLGSSGITNLDYTAGVSNGVVTSDAGTNATIPLADATNAGLFSAAEKSKLAGIEANAKDDQNASEVPYTATGNLVATNVQDALDELQGDIDNISAESNDLGITHNSGDIDITIEGGTGITIDAATQSLAGAMTAADKTKLDGIETGADVTDSTNVDAAGAVMNADTTTASMQFVIDEDNMSSDLDTKVPTQQSVKAYVDAEIADALSSEMSYQGAYDASTNPSSTASKGDTFTVSVAGTGVSNYWSTPLSVGDMIIAETNNPSSEADWTEVNKNIPDIVDASTTAKGIIEIATQTEVNTGTDTTRAVTPATLKNALTTTTVTYTQLIGNGSLTSIPVTHSIGNQFVQAQVFEGSGNLDMVECEIELTSSTVTTFKFNVAPASNAYRVVIIG